MGNNPQNGSVFFASGFLYNPVRNEILLHLRDGNTTVNPHMWGFFGGSSEDGESAKECCIREWHEELGILVQESDLIPLCDYLNTERNTWRYVFYMESALKKEEMTLGEGADFDWIPLEKVFEYTLTDKSIRDLKYFIQTLKTTMGKTYTKRAYSINEYSQDYPGLFEKERTVLTSIFGQSVDIKHIGSTAIPGLLGKPTIDILVVVKQISGLDQYISQMTRAGYTDLGEYVMPGARLFAREEDGIRLVNVHVFPQGHPHIIEMILVRDYLINHPDEVIAYGTVKWELSKKYPNDYESYRQEKNKYMAELLKRATKNDLGADFLEIL